MNRFKQPGGRFYLFALWLAGPPVWIMSIAALVDLIKGGTIDYESLGFGVSAIIGAVGLGSGVNKIGSAQQKRAERVVLDREG